jgi:hypothetical protein
MLVTILKHMLNQLLAVMRNRFAVGDLTTAARIDQIVSDSPR